MKRLKGLAKIFSFNHEQENSGLSVSLDELLEQKRYVAYLKALTQRLPTTNRAGDVKSAFKGRGVELEEIRSYTFGDDVRDIDWRVTARKEMPFTKLYAEEKDREIYTLVNLSPNMAFGTRKELKSVTAAKVTALLSWLVLENKDRLGCVIFDGKKNYIFKPQNHLGKMLAIFKKISKISQEILYNKTENFDSFTKSVMLTDKSIKSHATVFIVSDFLDWDETLKKAIAALAKKAKVFIINIFDILEENPPKAGEYMAENNGLRVVFDSDSKAFQKSYKAYFSIKRHDVRHFATKFGCKYIEIRSDIDLYKQLKIA